MAVTWITPAGSLGIVTERISLEIPLVASSPTRTVTFELLAGSLPRGLRLDNGAIKGSPVEVVKFTESKFVVRASDGIDIEDRTFTMSVDGADAPQWLTKEGFLNVGLKNAYYVLDNAYVNFQLEAEDNDVIAGDVLEYYLQPMDGELPPGLVLTNDGRIYGYTDPIFAVENQNSYTGGYDTSAFDILPLDKIEARSNGFDDYLYDVTTYDYSEDSRTPRRLSRFYTFLITVSDGRTQAKRLFRIYVVTEEFLKSDNSIVQVDTNVFQASSSSNRLPLWVTESNLGRHRANNYLTIFLDVYRAPGITGTLVYFLSDKNPDGTTSVLPPGMTLDQITGEVAGKVPYQRAVTRPFTFTVIAANFLIDVVTVSYTLKGAWKAATVYQINDAVVYNNIVWVCIQVGKNATPTEEPDYWQSSAAISEKTFTIQIIGEIESAIEWITDEDLGTIKANTPSQLTLRANSLLYGNSTLFDLISGTLPPGLTLLGTGEIEGKVKQFADVKGPGLTRFYDHDSSTLDSTYSQSYNATWDNGSTTVDKVFTFEVMARDTARFAESIKKFRVAVVNENVKAFANLYVKPLQKKVKRLNWFNFITDSSIFKPKEIYRFGDLNFGVQTELKVLLFAGIESTDAINFVQAMSRNHGKKRLNFGAVKSAKAKDPITQETIYEAIYVEIVDPLEQNGVSVSQTVELPNDISSPVLVSYNDIKVDSDIPFVSDRDKQRVFPTSIKNMRKRIQGVGERDRTYLPLWMRSIQDNALTEPGYVKALVLCYVQPGQSDIIMSRIKYSNFDFKTIDLEMDRYVIDVLDKQFQDQYLAFPTHSLNTTTNDATAPAAPVSSTPVIARYVFDSETASFDNAAITWDRGF